MKKNITILLCLCLGVFMAACGTGSEKGSLSINSETGKETAKMEEIPLEPEDITAPVNASDTDISAPVTDTSSNTEAASTQTQPQVLPQQPTVQEPTQQQPQAAQPPAEPSDEPAQLPDQQNGLEKTLQDQFKAENRIIATSAAVCDITDRLGIELIGVPETSVTAIAARYNGVQRIGSPMEPDMEIIKSLKPTDVIGPDTLKADLKIKYDNIGVNSTFVNLRSVQGLYDSVRLIGDKYGKSAEADEAMAEYNSFMVEYSDSHKDKESPKVLVLMGLPGSYLVATQNSYAGSLVELAGGTNVFHHENKDFLSVNPEEILATNPDVIIRTAHGLPKEALEMFEKEFSQNSIWKHFRAVKEGRVYDVDYMLFGMSATFDYPQALAELEPMLYGD